MQGQTVVPSGTGDGGAGVMSERRFPAPSTVSEQARAWLAVDGGELSYPAPEDTEAWLAMAERANRSTAQRFPVAELPVTVEDLDVAGTTVYAARPNGVEEKADELPMPAALVLNTPQVDLTEAGDTFQTLAGVDNVLRSLRATTALYAAGADPRDPYLSPLLGELSGFPPTFLRSGTRDLFLSNTVRMHRRLRGAGVEAELHVFEAMPHGGFGGDTPEDREAAAEQRRFLDKHRAPAAAVRGTRDA